MLMLRPIRKIDCAAALSATQKMIQRFALWLCKPGRSAAQVTEAEIQKLMNTPQEAAWLWKFLNGEFERKRHLERAQHLAALTKDQKKRLREWINTSTNVGVYFDLPPTGKQIPVGSPFENDIDGKTHWQNLKELMEAFYLKGLSEGLAYLPDGSPTADKKKALNYQTFRADFIKFHQLDKHEYARQVCVMCNGELRNASVDHWIPKADYPLLSVCADNLVPICGECNQSPNKGKKAVHTKGSFEDWFHPHLRHPGGALKVVHQTSDFGVTLTSTRLGDAKRVANLNTLFNLEQRWTRELKGEYRKLYNAILTRQRKKGSPLTLEDLCLQLADWADGLNPNQPHYEVHQVLAETLRDADRLMAWYTDLSNET
ncbi:hypothetical protein PS898_01618 [Pseudomonas fluorescens]|nr:hypothetical protein PS898_01618 [Pseudomonas fluorescens]